MYAARTVARALALPSVFLSALSLSLSLSLFTTKQLCCKLQNVHSFIHGLTIPSPPSLSFFPFISVFSPSFPPTRHKCYFTANEREKPQILTHHLPSTHLRCDSWCVCVCMCVYVYIQHFLTASPSPPHHMKIPTLWA